VPKALQDEAMGIDWMTLEELTEAIPPAYTEWIGTQLLAALRQAA
jgi:DNA (cytosine-5)-methyltransferase 1